MIRKFPKNVKMIYSVLTDYCGILDNIRSLGFSESKNFLRLKKLNDKTSLYILNEWLKRSNRSLVSSQFSLIEVLFTKAKLYPLYVKLMFDIISKWPSYYNPDIDFMNILDIDQCINYLFKILEEKHGKILFSRCCIYLTLFKSGISESEIDDIFSLDETILSSILTYHSTPNRRFPFYLWVLIKNDIQEYLAIRDSDDVQVVTWFHRRFFEVVNSMYRSKLSISELDEMLFNVIDYYIETWNNKPKPFVYSEHVQKN